MASAEVIEISQALNTELVRDTIPSQSGPQPPRLHQSIAHVLVTESPLHAWRQHRMLGDIQRKPSREMGLGSVTHRLLLGKGAEFERLEFADYRTKASKEARETAEKAGRIPILEADFQRARATAEIVGEKLEARGIRLVGESELYVEWEEETTTGKPVLCAGTFDHIVLADRWGHIYDLKTGESANPSKIERSMYNFGADIQWAAYTAAADRKFGLQGRVDMHFLFAEVVDPHCLTIVKPDGSLRMLGQQRWERAKDLWHECLTRDDWPEYSTGVVEITAPAWALRKEMEHD